jgi:hypothetical protein
MSDKTIIPIPQEKIDVVYEELKKLEEEAIKDLIIDSDMANNFNKTNSAYKWVSHYNRWKKLSNSMESEFKKIKSIRYFIVRDSNIYNMTEKEINIKLEADPIIISYKNMMDAYELTIAFIQKIQSLLDNQRYDIKEKLTYLRYLNGEDF